MPNKKKYVRIRPFVDIDILENLNLLRSYRSTNSSNEIYFNSGRAALKWLLTFLRKKRKSTLRVGVQAFNCSVVPQAIFESKNYPEFIETSSDCFSTRINNINFSKIDILILTHLFGIPSFDYEEIVSECQKRSIILIDDVAQTFGATVNRINIGELSDFTISSFGFDKPVSCFVGGLLKVNNKEYLRQLSSLYDHLSIEAIQSQKLDLKRLLLYYKLTDPEIFDMSLNYGGLIDNLVLSANWKPNIESAKKFNRIQKLDIFRRPYHLIRKINKRSSQIKILKMGDLKRHYLNIVGKNYQTELENRLEAVELAKNTLINKFEDLAFPIIPKNINAAWLRLPVLVSQSMRDRVVNWCHSKGIQAGQYNWPNLCFEPFSQFKIYKNKFPESRKISQTIVNFPVWSKEIWN